MPPQAHRRPAPPQRSAPRLLCRAATRFDGLLATRTSALRNVLEGANSPDLPRPALADRRATRWPRSSPRADIRQPQRPERRHRARRRRLPGARRGGLRRLPARRRRAWSSGRCRCRSQRSMAMPSRTQITRHDCVEGWSCIAKWTGVPLALVLDAGASVKPEARFVVFRCFDTHRAGAVRRRQDTTNRST